MTATKAPKLILPKSAKRPLCGLCKVELNEFYICPKCRIQHSPGVLGTVEVTSRFGAKSTWLDYKHGAVVYARKMRLQNAGVTVTWNRGLYDPIEILCDPIPQTELIWRIACTHDM